MSETSNHGSRISGATRVLAVIGRPVAHSLSPALHNAWFSEAGIDAVYGALELAEDRAEDTIAALWRAGLFGLNVTAPYKEAAYRAATSHSPEAAALEAANTLVRTPEGWRAHSTDGDGFVWGLRESIGPSAYEGLAQPDCSALILGAGGAGRAVLQGLAAAFLAMRFSLLNRSAERAERAIEKAGLTKRARAGGLEEAFDAAQSALLIVNTVGAPLDWAGTWRELGWRGKTACDISYGQGASWLAAAAAGGARTVDGLPMLAGQAALAFELWFGRSPDAASGLSRIRASAASRQTAKDHPETSQ